MQKNKFGTLSLISLALAVPLAVCVGKVVEAIYKVSNVKNIDTSVGLAYLKPILLSVVITLALALGFALVSAIYGLRKDESKTTAKLSLVVTAIVIVLLTVAAAANHKTEQASKTAEQQQLETFFDKLKAN